MFFSVSPAWADESEEAAEEAAEELTNETCLNCHTDADMVTAKYVVGDKALSRGPHTEDNGVTCVSCHTRAAKVEDVSDHGPLGKATCSECHDTAESITAGVHGSGKNGGKHPGCASCHGAAHAILPVADPKSPVHRQNEPETCGKCHAGTSLEHYKLSVHGQLLKKGDDKGPTCSSCHGAHKILHADNTRNPAFKVQMTRTCGECHQDVAKEYNPSVHGVALLERGETASASCVDCHLSHRILPPGDPGSSVHPTKVVDDCASCHADARLIRRFHLPKDVVSSYELSYHGKAGELGEARVANCSSCHRNHGIFRSSDKRSSVHPDNLQESCGTCHPGAGPMFVQGKIHLAAGSKDNYWAWFVERIYIWLIILVIGGMALHNLLDFIRKMILRARHQRSEPHIVRMTGLERGAHLLLLSSFLFLVYTGFALIYPKAWWVAPLNWISITEAFRSTSHRVAGVILSLIALHHLWFLFFHRVGKEQRRRLMPNFRDVRDLWHNVLFFFGARKERPHFGRFGYVEKAEYWALVWGTVVMAITGYVLWFEEEALQFMPLWLWEVFHVVHRLEAILAALAIAVWHFYHVMINPDEAPLSLTWLTGRISLEELRETRPAEYEELVQKGNLPKQGDETPPGEAKDK